MSKKKTETESVRGRLYEVTAKETKEDSFGPQERAVYDALKKLGPVTASQLGEKLKLETRQEPKLVAAFYLPRLRKAGFVRLARTAAQAA